MIQMPSSPRHQTVKLAAREPQNTDLIASSNWGLHCYNRRRKSVTADQSNTESFVEYSRWKCGEMNIAAETSPIARSVPVASPLEHWRRGDLCPATAEATAPVQRKATRIAHAKSQVLAEAMEASLVVAGSQRGNLARRPFGPKSQRPTSSFPEFDRWKRGNLDIEAETGPLGRSKSVTTPLEPWRAETAMSDVANADAAEVNSTSALSGSEGRTEQGALQASRGDATGLERPSGAVSAPISSDPRLHRSNSGNPLLIPLLRFMVHSTPSDITKH